jgi:hypothetical protein
MTNRIMGSVAKTGCSVRRGVRRAHDAAAPNTRLMTR